MTNPLILQKACGDGTSVEHDIEVLLSNFNLCLPTLTEALVNNIFDSDSESEDHVRMNTDTAF